MSNIAYVRVSTLKQNTESQEEAIKKTASIDKWFIEKISGKNIERTQFKSMLNYVRAGDIVYIRDFSRLARSTKDLLETIEFFNKNNITLISLKENLDTSTATGKLLVTMIGAINEFERENTLERQIEGIEIAKGKGKYKGRKKLKINYNQLQELYIDYKKGYITIKEICEKMNFSRSTFYKKIKELDFFEI